jgi:hypothetical protein
MTRDDIETALVVSRDRTVCVLRDRPPGIRGYVRTVSIHPDNRVQIAFDVEGLEEGGAYFWGTYPSLDKLIAALERFLGQPLDSWSGALAPHGASGSPDHDALAQAIRDRTLQLPDGPSFALKSSYWERFVTPV